MVVLITNGIGMVPAATFTSPSSRQFAKITVNIYVLYYRMYFTGSCYSVLVLHRTLLASS